MYSTKIYENELGQQFLQMSCQWADKKITEFYEEEFAFYPDENAKTVKHDSMYFLINTEGEILGEFDYLSDVLNGNAIAKEDDSFFIVDEFGECTSLEFDSIERILGTYFYGVKDDVGFVLNARGWPIHDLKFQKIEVQDSERCYFKSIDGNGYMDCIDGVLRLVYENYSE